MTKKYTLWILLLNLAFQVNAGELKPYKGNMQSVDFTLKDLSDQTHRLSQYHNRIVLVNFWATWCPPCIEELPSLVRLQTLFKDKPFSILTIDVGEPKELITPFLEQVKATDLTVLMDTEGHAHKNWNIYVFPSNFLLDKTGKIRYAAIGALNWDDPEVVKIIDQLLLEHNNNG